MLSHSIGAYLATTRFAQLAFVLAIAVFAMPAHAYSPQLPETGFDLQPNAAPNKASKKKKPGSDVADKQAVEPNATIAVTSLGFAPPAPYYLGGRYSQASLGFLDENNLLFTFRVPGLIPREPGQSQPSERHIRALTLSISTGDVIAEGLWSVHDYEQYLWIMQGGKFLLRDRNLVQIGDASLRLAPFLRFPGSVRYLELDPAEQLLVTNTSEPPAPEEHPQQGSDNPLDGNSSAPDIQGSRSAASGMITNAGSSALSQRTGGSSTFTLESGKQANQNLVRILSLANRKVLLFSRTNGTVHIPVDGDGYYESLRGNDNKWMIGFEFFSGATVPLAWVDSTCDPALEALAPGLVLASACSVSGSRHLTAILRNRDKDHTRLWEIALPPTKVWPVLARSADGLRFARSTLDVTHPVTTYSPLDNADIRGQSVQVYNTATGQLQLSVPASPILDAGGNFALSPSGKRLAVLNNGSIQVFDLPAAPPIPATK